mmetsp:Transcript_21192/g.60508  ORF Transcript_21192/g.60508 Transcript_21192/m.60508 type:complete len:233 (+) Transcript_21192:253-951(+)
MDCSQYWNSESRISWHMPTVTVTPSISIITWMVVLECAGSMWTIFITNGRVAPIATDMNTIMNRLLVMATVSTIGTLKTMARMNPANPSRQLKLVPINNSSRRNCLVFPSWTVPIAKPRMTRTLAWLPAFPPAPTSMVRNCTMTPCFFNNDSFLAMMKDDIDCNTRSPINQPARSWIALQNDSGSSPSFASISSMPVVPCWFCASDDDFCTSPSSSIASCCCCCSSSSSNPF